MSTISNISRSLDEEEDGREGAIGLGAGAGDLFGSITGNALAQMDEREADALIKASLDEFNKIDIPKLQRLVEMKVQASGIKPNEQARLARMQALRRLMEQDNQGGLDMETRAQLEDINAQVGARNASERAAIMNAYRRRGMAGSGRELSAQLQGAADGAARASAAGFQTHRDAMKRAYEARLAAANIGQGVERDDMDHARWEQDRMDNIHKFNAGLARDNNRATMDEYQARMDRAKAANDIRAQQAQRRAQAAQRKRGRGRAIGSAVGAIGGSALGPVGGVVGGLAGGLVGGLLD